MTDVPKTRVRQRMSQTRAELKGIAGRGDLLTSLMLVFPLFLVYEIAVAFTPVMNGVDFVTRNLLALVNYDKGIYLAIHGALAVAFVVLVLVMRKRQGKRQMFKSALPMLLESGIYALTLGTFIIFVMHKLLGISPSLAVGDGGPALNLVMSLGAGVHEELVFRLGGFAGGAALLVLVGVERRLALTLAFVVSSMLFSAAHHVGAMGEPWTFHVFVYRTLAGMVFAALFYWRSLAHAVYTHALYDVYVLVFR